MIPSYPLAAWFPTREIHCVSTMARIKSIDNRDYYLGGIKLDRVDVEKDKWVLVSHKFKLE